MNINSSHPPTRLSGLTAREAERLRAEGKVNTAPEKISKTAGQIIRDNVCTLFNLYNALICVAMLLVGAYKNISYIFIVITNVVISIVQELHAKKLVDDLSLIGAIKAGVIRGGVQTRIPVEELVLGDLTVIGMGEQICADSAVVEGEIEVNESLLTGEADPVVKRPGDKLLSGSFVVSGRCYAVVEHVGADNFVSKLASGAQKYKKIHSELLDSMRRITKFTSYFIIPIGILLFLQAFLLRGGGNPDILQDSVVTTAAALLGMLPKGMVLLISASLVVGTIKLSKQKVLVQDLYSIETLAHVDMLCLDKTGTITEGKMRVSNLYPAGKNPLSMPVEEAISIFIGAMEDNNATFLALAERFPADETKSNKILRRVAFSSQRKWSAAVIEGVGTLAIGAPEKLLDDPAKMPVQAREAQEDGKRILCLGFTPETGWESPENGGCPPNLELIAAIELSDPIRENAPETLAFFKREGVRIKVISGDNPATVSSVARQAGLEDYASAVDLSALHTDQEVMDAATKYSVFGRVTPGQKSLLVTALKQAGHTVAMTGDGVNDVLALKEADCSIAMAAGSDATRQVSKLVLMDSDFTAIPDVVMEGRRVVNNITRLGGVFLVKTIYSVFLSIYFIISNSPFPFIPLQVMLYDFVIEATPAFILSFEPDANRLSGRFIPNVLRRAMPFALLVLINVIAAMYISPLFGISAGESRTMMYFVTCFAGLMALFKACRPFNKMRAAVCAFGIAGFFSLIYLCWGILDMSGVAPPAVMMLAGMAVFCIPLKMLMSWCVEKFLVIYPKIKIRR